MKKFYLMLTVIILFPIFLTAQTTSDVDSFIVAAKKNLVTAVNNWNEVELIAARSMFERLITDQTYPWLIHYYIALTDYRLTSFCLGKQNKDAALKYLDDGIDHLNKSVELKDDFVDAHNLLSALYGNKIGLKPLHAMMLGPKSDKAMAQAMKLDACNPRNHLIAGHSAYFTPRMFGGSKEKAKASFERALACFDSVSMTNLIYPDWGHEEAHTWLGIYYKNANDLIKAKECFEKALAINPQFNWVKYDLLPAVIKELDEQKR